MKYRYKSWYQLSDEQIKEAAKLTPKEQKAVDAFIKAVDPANIIEVVRSGVSGIARGERCLSV